MTTGTIYLAKNTISGKCYVGQTIRTLEQRKREHLRKTINDDYKFGRALQKYPKDSWEWSILAEADIEKLNDLERYFVKDLDSYKNGYNCNVGGGWNKERNPNYKTTIYELWHPEHGEIRETLSELLKRSNSFTHIQELSKGTRHQIFGFVLLKNKEKYKEILKIHKFYHPDQGIIECTCSELYNKYREYFKSSMCFVRRLATKSVNSHFGWVLAENKDRYEDIINPSTYITLTHKKHGTLTLKRSEFRERFGLHDSNMTLLKNGKAITHKGWSLSKM